MGYNNEECLKNGNFCITYAKKGYVIFLVYDNIHFDNYIWGKEQNKMILLVMNNQPISFVYDEIIKITEEKDYFKMLCSSG